MLINNSKSLIHYSQILLKKTLFIFEATEPLNFRMLSTLSLTNTPRDCGAHLLHYPTHQNKWRETEQLPGLWYFFLVLLSYHVELWSKFHDVKNYSKPTFVAVAYSVFFLFLGRTGSSP